MAALNFPMQSQIIRMPMKMRKLMKFMETKKNHFFDEILVFRFILIGNKELCIRTNLGNKIQETRFKVTRMRCWRVTTNYNVSQSTNLVGFTKQKN